MKPWRIVGRIVGVSVAVPLCVALVYALVVPAFLGREESAREALIQATALVTLLALATLSALPLRYVGAVLRTARALEKREALDESTHARLYAAPREGAVVAALFAFGLLGTGLAYLHRDINKLHAVAAVVGAAFAMTASLVYYPALRRALRPLFEALPPSMDAPVALGDRLPVRVALAVAAPSGIAALLAAMLVAAHVAATAHDQDELNAKVFSVALGVRRQPGESAEGRAVAARVLAAGGQRVTEGVELPLVEAPPVRVPSPTWALVVGVVFAGVGAALGLRIGRRAARELAQSTRRVETVSVQQLSPANRSYDAAGFTFTFEVLSFPEVRAISRALDRVTEKLAAMARDQRRAVNARAEAARLRSFVLAGVSHDLRGPLNSVLGFGGLLLSGVDGDITAGQRESLEALCRSGTDLLRIVDDLLDAARLDAGRMTLNRTRVLVGDLIDDARRTALERTAGSIPEDVRLPAEGDLDLEALVDRERMAHHLGALLAFALLRKGAASPTGASAPVTMHVRVVDDSTWTLTILGHGTTPPRETLEQLFDPFELPPSGARAPAGLGLAIGVARRVIELHGGTARAHVAPDGGLALHVTLTRARPRTLTPGPVPSARPSPDALAGASEA